MGEGWRIEPEGTWPWAAGCPAVGRGIEQRDTGMHMDMIRILTYMNVREH